jgi:hypothetical protein
VVHKHLVDSGVPEAFLGRQDAIVLMRPLVQDAKARVSGRLLSDYITRVQATTPGLKVTWDEQFLQIFARAFYTHNRGARSVRAVIEDHIAALITRSRMELINKGHDFSNVELKLTITDNAPTKAYTRSAQPEREIKLLVQVLKDGREVSKDSINATQAAATVVTLGRKDAKAVAIREAAQIAVNDESLTQENLEYASVRVEITQGEPVLGYVRFSAAEGASYQMNRTRVVARMARHYAGRLAQEGSGFDLDSTWSSDLQKMRQIATDYFEKYGLSDGLISVRHNELGEPQLSGEQKKMMEDEMKGLFAEAKDLATRALESNKVFIKRLSGLLLTKGEITREDVEKLRGRFEKVPCRDLFKKGS